MYHEGHRNDHPCASVPDSQSPVNLILSQMAHQARAPGPSHGHRGEWQPCCLPQQISAAKVSPSCALLSPHSATGTADTQSAHRASRKGVTQTLPPLRDLESSCGQRCHWQHPLPWAQRELPKRGCAGRSEGQAPCPTPTLSVAGHVPRTHVSPAPRCHRYPSHHG